MSKTQIEWTIRLTRIAFFMSILLVEMNPVPVESERREAEEGRRRRQILERELRVRKVVDWGNVMVNTKTCR